MGFGVSCVGTGSELQTSRASALPKFVPEPIVPGKMILLELIFRYSSRQPPETSLRSKTAESPIAFPSVRAAAVHRSGSRIGDDPDGAVFGANVAVNGCRCTCSNVQVRSGQVRYITRPKSRTMRVTRQLMLPPSTVT